MKGPLTFAESPVIVTIGRRGTRWERRALRGEGAARRGSNPTREGLVLFDAISQSAVLKLEENQNFWGKGEREGKRIQERGKRAMNKWKGPELRERHPCTKIGWILEKKSSDMGGAFTFKKMTLRGDFPKEGHEKGAVKILA